MLTYRLQVYTGTQQGLQSIHVLAIHRLENVHISMSSRELVRIGVATCQHGRDFHRLVLNGNHPSCLAAIRFVFRIYFTFVDQFFGKPVSSFIVRLQFYYLGTDIFNFVFRIAILYSFVKFLPGISDFSFDII